MTGPEVVVVVVVVVVVIAAVVVVVVVVVAVVLTLTHRYNPVRGHRTGSNNCILPLFNMNGIL